MGLRHLRQQVEDIFAVVDNQPLLRVEGRALGAFEATPVGAQRAVAKDVEQLLRWVRGGGPP